MLVVKSFKRQHLGFVPVYTQITDLCIKRRVKLTNPTQCHTSTSQDSYMTAQKTMVGGKGHIGT